MEWCKNHGPHSTLGKMWSRIRASFALLLHLILTLTTSLDLLPEHILTTQRDLEDDLVLQITAACAQENQADQPFTSHELEKTLKN